MAHLVHLWLMDNGLMGSCSCALQLKSIAVNLAPLSIMHCVGFGEVLSCRLTHTAVVALDLVKCYMQVDPKHLGAY